MSIWKQVLVSVLLLVVAAGIWVRFSPGAPATLDRVGLGWAAAAIAPAAPVGAPGPGGPGGGGPGGFGGPALVVTAYIGTATINDRLSAIGTGRALRAVSVTPFVSGRLTGLHVDSGSRVEAGAPLAELDSEAEEIALDRARIALEDANARLQRINQLRAVNTATAVQVTEAELAVSNARLALRDAELTLERRTIVAPISGVVGILPVSSGNYVTTQTEIATIDDRSQILVDFWVPERFAGMISVGDRVDATSVARISERLVGEVSAIDNRIDAQSRTLRVQARVENPNDHLRAGMSFQISMTFPGDSYPAVDPLAIQWGTEGAYVWAVEDGRARRVTVAIVQRNTDSVLVSGDFGGGAMVVTEGVHAVREGAELRIVQRNGDAAPAAGMPQASVARQRGT